MGVPYEGNGFASLSFVTWLTSAEIVLLLLSVGVLSIAFLMFVRLSDALSPPTKALTWVVGSNVALALFLLAFGCFQMYHYARKQFIPQGGIFCHWFNPIILVLVVFGWLGQPVIAWTTLKTLRNEAVTDLMLRRIFGGCIGVSLAVYAWGVSLSPGVIVNGSFCVMVPKTPVALEARGFGNFVGLATFITSIVLYVKSYRHLRRLKLKLQKDLTRLRHPVDPGGGIKELEISSLDTESQPSHCVGGKEAGDGSDTLPLEGDVESGAACGGGTDAWERGGLPTPAHHCANGGRGLEEDEDAPFTYAELQERTQAARRAVNVLLPDRTDDVAGREGPFGLRRRTGLQSTLQEGVCLRALVEQDTHKHGSAAESDGKGRASSDEESSPPPLNNARYRWRRLCGRAGFGQGGDDVEEAVGHEEELQGPHAEVLRLCDKAMRAVVGRGCTLMTIYYVPSYVLFFCLALYENFRPPPDVLPIFALVFFLGTPVLQTVALLHLAVKTGSNILQFYRRQQQETHKGVKGGMQRQGSTDAVAMEGAGGLDRSNSSGGTSSGGLFLYEQGSFCTSSSRADSQRALLQRAFSPPPVQDSGAGASGSGDGPRDGFAGWDAEAPPVALVDAPMARRGLTGLLAGLPPSSLRRYAGGGSSRGGKRGKGGRQQQQQQHMQALSTIYEVAFKGKGRDAAAAFREATPATAAAAAAAAEQEDEGKCMGHTAVPAMGGGSGGRGRSSMAKTLQQNSLIQEMLGVEARRSSSTTEGSSEGSSSVGVEDEHSGYGGGGGGAFPWRHMQRFRSRSRSVSLAEHSEISSLTDAQDYQQFLSSWGPSPANDFCRGGATPFFASSSGLSHFGADAREEEEEEEEEEEGGCRGDPCGGASVDSWGQAGRETTMRRDPPAAAGNCMACGGRVAGVAGLGQVHALDLSGRGSSTSSVLSDGGART